MADTLLRKLLAEPVWDRYGDLIGALKSWEHFPKLLRALDALDASALYQSPIHGQDHIERTLFFSALIAMQEGADGTMTEQLFGCASYHDVGRLCDFYETGHGFRSAAALPELVAQTGELLLEMQGAVSAHSWPDGNMREVISRFAPADLPRTVELAKMLKDADGLDRVRISDLSPRYMRHAASRRLAESGIAQFLYDIYRERLDLQPFSLPEWKRTHGIK